MMKEEIAKASKTMFFENFDGVDNILPILLLIFRPEAERVRVKQRAFERQSPDRE